MTDEKRKAAHDKSVETQRKNRERRKKKFLKALEEGSGIQAYALDMCKLSRQTVNTWKHEDDDFAQKCKNIEDNCIDRVEAKLLEKINDGDITAIIFYLKTKGKSHGYVQQVDQNIVGSPFEKLMRALPDEPESEDDNA